MQEAPTTFDWVALLRLIGQWLLVVFLALRALDWLFPRLRRGEGDAPPRPEPPIRRALGPRPLPGVLTALPRIARRPTDERAPAAGEAQWGANLRSVAVRVASWVGASFVPAGLSPLLTQSTLLT